jgi:hypothetical protein
MKRIIFLKNSAAFASIAVLPSTVWALTGGVDSQNPLATGENDLDPGQLAKNFAFPPDSARPWVYAFWLNGNISRGGITADLEAMKRAGIGGMTVMEVDQGTPVGPVDFMSDEWRELFRHLVAEASRLGLEVNMNNDSGWNGSGGPWVPLDEAMQVITTSELQVRGGTRFDGELPMPPVTMGYYRDIAVLAFPTPADPSNPANRIVNLEGKGMSYGWQCGSLDVGPDVPAESVISGSKILDLTPRMNAGGKLLWDSPELQGSATGEWTVLRLGHTFTGKMVHPAPKSGTGPECDKLSKEAIEHHYNEMIGKLVKNVGPLAGKTLVSTHVDSCEHGAQNWTPKMREEFRKRRGYDMMPFMPVMTGRIVDSLEISERFLLDVRQTVSDLFAENYIGHLRTLANRDGLRLSMESLRNPANDLDVANQVDEPMCEFWSDETNDNIYWCVKAMSSAAHVNGRPVVAGEAFTCMPGERWLAHPATLKALGDRAFCDGVNRFVVHRYAMQPWVEERWPGMTMGPYGVHYDRSNTWWADSIAWHQYIARCQYMLRQGTFVADALWLQPEEPMKRLWDRLEVPGYDYDAIGPHAFMKDVGVKHGKLYLPSGMEYRLLVLPEGEYMTPEMLDKIRNLVQEGATVVGRPPKKAAGLSGYPMSDELIARTAKELWGSDVPPESGERKAGKGRVVWGRPLPEALAAMGVVPDFTSRRTLRYIHRELNGMDIYFVANPDPNAVEALCTFRVNGKAPEVWFPDSGRIEKVSAFEETNGCTRIPLRFEPVGSMFIVFRKGKAKASGQIVSVTRDEHELLKSNELVDVSTIVPVTQPPYDPVSREISRNGTYEIRTAGGKIRRIAVVGLSAPQQINGPWELKFAPGRGAPEKIMLDDLVSWSDHSNSGVRYFSGSATYRKKINIAILPESESLKSKIYLDLGRVAIMAEVWLNGKILGILWKAPYCVDITDAATDGDNTLEIRVVNLPVNRMIGDEFLPEDSERTKKGTLSEWPKWLEEGKPSPTGRFTFTTWRLWKKEDTLQESGLLGPVTLRMAMRLDKF